MNVKKELRSLRMQLAIVAVLLGSAVTGFAQIGGAKKGPCEPHDVTGGNPADCSTPPLGCNFLYPVCPDTCDAVTYTDAFCEDEAGPCLLLTVTGPTEICNDCRCDWGAGSCKLHEVDENGSTSFKICG